MEFSELLANYFEPFAAAVAFTYVIFQILQKNLMWYLSIFAAVCYCYVYLTSGLYAMTLLQVYLIVAGVYGLLQWKKSKKNAAESGIEKTILIKQPSKKIILISSALSVGIFFLLHWILAMTDDAHPWMDSFLSTMVMAATFYTGRQYLFSWLMWFVYDSISVVFYIKMGMYPTSALFSCYVVMAAVGYFNWKKNGVRV